MDLDPFLLIVDMLISLVYTWVSHLHMLDVKHCKHVAGYYGDHLHTQDSFCSLCLSLWQFSLTPTPPPLTPPLLPYYITSVQFSSLTNCHWGDINSRMIQQRSLPFFFWRRLMWAVLAWVGMSTLSADHSVANPPTSPEVWYWRGYYGVWPAQTMQVFISCLLPEEFPAGPQRSWS